MVRFLRSYFTTGLTWAALGLHLIICTCYLRRWDKVAAITVFPFWAWGLAGAGMAGVAWLLARRRAAALVCGLWTATVLIGADETRPLLRFSRDKPQPGAPRQAEGRTPLRLITLNCRAGMWNPAALDDIAPWQPDIVFLQESPYPAELQKFAARLYGRVPGHWAGGSHCGIVCRGTLRDVFSSYQPASILGTIEVAPGRVVEVACVHLGKAATDLRLWRRAAWVDHYNNRQERRMALARVLGVQRFISRQHAAIIGGDFNAPAGDAVFDLLSRSGFRDAFTEAGSGWPDTYPNTAPVLRIDHLWVNAGIVPQRAAAVKTLHSDHRMVVCDFLLPP